MTQESGQEVGGRLLVDEDQRFFFLVGFLLLKNNKKGFGLIEKFPQKTLSCMRRKKRNSPAFRTIRTHDLCIMGHKFNPCATTTDLVALIEQA